jgi:hypothetical protein
LAGPAGTEKPREWVDDLLSVLGASLQGSLAKQKSGRKWGLNLTGTADYATMLIILLGKGAGSGLAEERGEEKDVRTGLETCPSRGADRPDGHQAIMLTDPH